MLEIVDLVKRYEDGVLALDGLNLKVARGEIYVMLGPNGAGKTTTVNLIFNFIQPTSGTIKVKGIDAVRDPLGARRHAAFVSEDVRLYDNFTPRQNLDFFARLQGKRRRPEEYDRILNEMGLPEDSFRRRVKDFSKGMRQRLGIAVAILKDAELVVLDEPTSGLDPKGAREFLALLRKLRSDGKTIFMTTHDIFRARQIADRVGIMSYGRLVGEMARPELEGVDLEEIYVKYVEEHR
ncbi:MAG: ABC transporter ATP-binding protein [Thaumarchaeota archaeon]|nr:MAG: ABC transporter ATP-binding protein [Nitrososphaerota archaeon]